MTFRVRVPQALEHGRRYGRLDLLDGRATVVQRHLRRGGLRRYQRPTNRTLLALFQLQRPGFVFFDVGANIGLYAALCKFAFPAARVVAFEPAPDTAAVAREIMRVNGLDVVVEEVAVSDRSGERALHLSATSDASHSLVEGFRATTGMVPVAVMTVDEYVAQHDSPPAVMKVDVEAHEAAVVRGARSTIETHRPYVVAEVLTREAGAGLETRRLLAEHGYTAYPLRQPASWEPAAPGEADAGTEPVARDWLFAPGPLPAGFERLVAEWDAVVRRCRSPRAQRRRKRRRRRARVATRALPPPPGLLDRIRRRLRPRRGAR